MFIYEKAFLKGYQHLIDQGYVEHRVFTSKEISSFLGKNPMDMWQTLCPTLDKTYIQEASQMISKEMLLSIQRNEAKLYPNVIEILTYLKEKGYVLVYLSNSKNYYMEAMRQSFQLERFFDLFLTSEMYNFIPKKMILKEIIHNLEKEW
ncbi:MAG: HAD hydrolase-like protein [Acholeplasmataceae bacterium]|nr:HAD hydrolase-like protein [Acholeplasmataceae bacterium]